MAEKRFKSIRKGIQANRIIKTEGVIMNDSREEKKQDMEWSRIFNCIAICTVFAILIYVRVSWFYLHFTHYDDIQVAHLTDYTADCFAINFANYKMAGGLSEKIYNLCYYLFHDVYNWGYYAVNFSKYWTYAPGQFVLTFALLPLAQGYNGVKFFGRLPSLLNGILAIFVCWHVLNRATCSKKAALIGTCSLGLSWQAILYCMHMSNYESIILCGFVTALLLFRNLNVTKGSNKKWIWGALTLGAMTWLHYQVLCLFCGYFLTYFVYCIIHERQFKKILYKHILIGTLYGITVFPLLFFANMKSVASWNAGAQGQFLFQFKMDLIYIIKFFVKNIYLVLKAMLSPVSLNSNLSDIFACSYLALIVLGVMKGLKDYRKKNGLFFLTIFNVGVFLSEIIFVFLGKFTLSPTRHCNLLIPVFVIEIGIGCDYLFKYIKNKLYAFLPYTILCVMCFCFLNEYDQIKEKRIDLFTEDMVENIVETYSPDVIVGRYAPQMWYLLNEIDYGHRNLIDYQTDIYCKNDSRNGNKVVMVVSSAIPVDLSVVEEMSDELVRNEYLTQNDIDKLSSSVECVCIYEKVGDVDFDFYNVTYGGSNNMYYSIYTIK